jgi:predicted murein hydrolase (TIGR00659 family)
MREIFSSQAFGIMLTLLFYLLGGFLYKKTRFPFFSPLLVATLLLMGYILIAKIDMNTFLTDLSGIHLFLGPLIVSLAVPIMKQIQLIKKYILPIMVGSIVGAATSILAVFVLARWLNLEQALLYSILPKASTTPIAIEVSEQLGGIRAITVATVVMTAVLGAVLVPTFLKWFNIKDPLIIGMGLGTTSQAVGTAKALEMDPTAGAISGVALVFTGIATAIMALFIH